MLEKNKSKHSQRFQKKPKKVIPPKIVEAWESYFKNKDEYSKNQLIEHYQFLVRNITRPFWTKKPFILDIEDLHQAGRLGLIQAIERYKKDAGASFETFAQLRVRGSILDEINSLDWTPRNMRRLIREVIAAESKLMALGKDPSVENLSEETGYTHEEIRRAKSSSHRTFVLPVDHDLMRENEVSSSANEMPGMNSPLDGNSAGSEGLDFRLAIMSELTIEEQQVIYLRYFYCESVGKTAKILGITPSRVSVIQKRSLDKLRKIIDFPA